MWQVSFMAIFWLIWKERNTRCFENKASLDCVAEGKILPQFQDFLDCIDYLLVFDGPFCFFWVVAVFVLLSSILLYCLAFVNISYHSKKNKIIGSRLLFHWCGKTVNCPPWCRPPPWLL